MRLKWLHINVDRPQGGDIFLCAPPFHTVWTADLPDDCICLIFIQPCCIEIFQLLQLIILKQFLPPLMYTVLKCLCLRMVTFKSDVLAFQVLQPAEEGQFLCETTNECIPVEFVCDRYNDCGDDENEFCPYGRVTCSNTSCIEECNEVPSGSYSICSCRDGFRPNKVPHLSGLRSCEDINECLENDPCDQICDNIKGSYRCRCTEGYQLLESSMCLASDKRPRLLYASGSEIRFLNYDTNREGTVVHGEGRVASLDTHKDTVIWTDSSLKVIKRAKLPFSDDDVAVAETIVQEGINLPSGISVDFMGGNIFWVDQGVPFSVSRTRRQTVIDTMVTKEVSRISVAKLDGSSPRTLVQGLSGGETEIVVNPRRGYMYWTNKGENASIEWAFMNGENREVLVMDMLQEPAGLTIDFAKDDTIYFCDSHANRIESMNWNGTGRRLIRQSEGKTGILDSWGRGRWCWHQYFKEG
ncbi:putative low-density lipoprotein receptor-related protein 2 [Apostichopus japonicus]|uniref:Putative low-density lipoprotein receptor-related protein 2 n=1 Tax=Stichopus japonicus TaxID=307972 RepID=A0A2G8KPJ3_STIJA|nr:putative low-density lipoprotein receptor-related protein 2 [Apostichopus japonicus]